MKEFDQYIRDTASREELPMPKNFHDRVENTLSGLPEITAMPSRRRMPRFLTSAACFFFTFFMLLPNVSPVYASAASRIPVIGALVEVFTIRDYDYRDASHELLAEVPAVSVPGGGAGEENVNTDARELVERIVKDFYDTLDQGPNSVTVTYETVTNTPEWFTLKLTVEEIQASGAVRYVYYHIDPATGSYVTLGDLFDAEGRRFLSRQVLEQMNETDYFPGELPEELSEQQNFYFENGDLVLVFDEYTIAPGSMGTPSFTIPAEAYRNYLA